MTALDLLSSRNYIIVNKTLIKTIGLEEAIVLGELCSEYKYWKEENKLIDNMFYSSIQNIENNTGLSEYQQRKAIKSLENIGIISVTLKGIPATRYFEINENKLFNILRTSSEKTKELDTEKLSSNNNNKNNKKNNNTISKDIVENFEFGINKTQTVKPKKLSLYDKCVNLIKEFTDDTILQEYLIQFLKICLENSRDSGRTLYVNTFKGKLNSLKKLSDDNYVQRKIVMQTLDNGWAGFYELKEDKKKRNVRRDIEKLPEVEEVTKEEKESYRRSMKDGQKF